MSSRVLSAITGNKVSSFRFIIHSHRLFDKLNLCGDNTIINSSRATEQIHRVCYVYYVVLVLYVV